MCNPSGALEPHVSGPRHVNPHQLLHEIHPLLPQFDELRRTRLRVRRPEAGELAVDDGNAIFQRGRDRRRPAAHHPRVGVVALELLLERRRFPLDRSEICGVCLPGAERPEHEQPGYRRRRRHAPCPPTAAAPAPREHRIAHHRPAIPRGAPGRQGLELRHALIQRIELPPARRAHLGVRACPAGGLARLQRQQIVHRAMHHDAAPSSSSMPRRRACARASCDLEKLTVRPICSAISSCVYPSTSCSHTTARDVSLNCSKARSRSIRAGTPLTGPWPPAASSSSGSAARTWLRRIRIRAFDAAICRIHPHRCPSPRYCAMLFTTSRNVSCSTSSASSGLRRMRSARLYSGVSNARYSASSASRSPDLARATRMSGTVREMVIS